MAARVCNGGGGLSIAIRLSDRLWRIIRLERGDPDKDDDVPEEAVEHGLGLERKSA
ncbi:hypothetical protein H0E84_08700 [Luteimonas sp. SJ-92]|uniref:Uncharacterized protein n=1 Tax=Luteimonas salinisoli TaxID=2752307 RepID=A0A853JCI8_9GAMM|nr:hypothetical protein [Luteimonas salinisoli]NZA26464.1 hypothetical protein [Luteimonas salinisoli]